MLRTARQVDSLLFLPLVLDSAVCIIRLVTDRRSPVERVCKGRNTWIEHYSRITIKPSFLVDADMQCADPISLAK